MNRRALALRLLACMVLGLLTTWSVAAALATWLRTANAKMALDIPTTWHGDPQGVVSMRRQWTFGTERREIDWQPKLSFMSGNPYSRFLSLAKSNWVDGAPVRTKAWGVLSDMTWDQVAEQRRGAEEARGWPMLAFWWWAEPDSSTRGYAVHGGIELPLRTGARGLPIDLDRILPLLPIWRGLLVNTLFYALIWFAILPVPRLLLRGRRRRQGHCPHCAYDLRGQAVRCPECGRSVAGAASQPPSRLEAAPPENKSSG